MPISHDKTIKFHSLTAIFLRLLVSPWRPPPTKITRQSSDAAQIAVKPAKTSGLAGFIVTISLKQNYHLDTFRQVSKIG